MSMQLPVEAWLQGHEHTFHLKTTQQVQLVTIDPENKLPDSNRENNVWKGLGAVNIQQSGKFLV